MGDKVVKIDENIYEDIAKLSQQSGKSIKDIITEALMAYVRGSAASDKPIKAMSNKIISLQYGTRCFRCKTELRPGDLAYYIKITYEDNTARSFIYCLDCYMPDKAMAKAFLKKRELEKTIRGLKKIAEELASEIDMLKLEKSMYEIEQEIYNTYRNAINTFSESKSDDAVKKLLELLERLSNLAERVANIEEDLKILLEKKRKKVVEVEQK